MGVPRSVWAAGATLKQRGWKMTKVTSIANNGNAMVEIGPIDPHMLKDQIELLIDSIIEDGDSPLWGIVYMLEDIADEIEMEKLRELTMLGQEMG
jgi:hypothetical protein